MKYMKVILLNYKINIFSIFGLLIEVSLLSLFLFLTIYAYTDKEEFWWIPLIFSGLFTHSCYKDFNEILNSRKVQSLFESLGISEDIITLPGYLKFEKGFFKAVGSISSGHYGSSYSTNRTFIFDKKEEKVILELEEKPFLLAVDHDGVGIIHLPGVKFLDKKYKNVLVLYIKPSYIISFSQDRISVSYENDHAELRVFKKDNGFRCSLDIATRFSEARKAVVEIIPEDTNFTRRIVESKIPVEFNYKFLEEGPIVMISHSNYISPRIILKRLKLKDGIVSGHGKFLLRLSLDLPFKKDIKEEIILTVKPLEK